MVLTQTMQNIQLNYESNRINIEHLFILHWVSEQTKEQSKARRHGCSQKTQLY